MPGRVQHVVLFKFPRELSGEEVPADHGEPEVIRVDYPLTEETLLLAE